MIKISRATALFTALGFGAMLALSAHAAETRGNTQNRATVINLPSANGLIWDINESEGYIGDGNQDAFDSYGGLRIEVKDAANMTLLSSAVVDTLGLVASGSNRMATTTPYVAAGVSITRSLYAIPGTNLLRYIDKISNTSGAVRKVRIAFGAANGDLGSDDNTRVAGTSSGDLFITTADNWMVSIQGAVDANSAAGDPPVGVAWSNRSAAAAIGSGNSSDPLSTAFAGDTDDGFSPVYDFTLNAGETKYLAHFVYRGMREAGEVNPESIRAVGDEKLLAISTIAGVVGAPPFSDLTPQERAALYNWSFAAAAEPINVPTTGAGALAALAGLLALSALALTRRRKGASPAKSL